MPAARVPEGKRAAHLLFRGLNSSIFERRAESAEGSVFEHTDLFTVNAVHFLAGAVRREQIRLSAFIELDEQWEWTMGICDFLFRKNP